MEHSLKLYVDGTLYGTIPTDTVQLPRLDIPGKTFLGWNRYSCLTYGQSCADGDGELHAIFTDGPAYVLESHFLDVEDMQARCQFRRYVVEVYLENAQASSGVFQIENVNHLFYYLGNIPEAGVAVTVDAVTDRRGGPYHNVAFMTTSRITVNWESKASMGKRQRLLTLYLAFSRWGISSREVEKRTADEILIPSYDFQAKAGEKNAFVSANFYSGVRFEKPLQKFDGLSAKDKVQLPLPRGQRLCRFAYMADTHIGERYGWGGYDWLKGVYKHLEQLHREDPLDFVLELGDTLDDGYAKSYEPDYNTYLELVKDLTICDSENPLAGEVPHYEMMGNHDTAPQTRFFDRKLWYAGKVAFIAFFANYGGYPAVNGSVDPSGVSYRSYGVLRDEMIDFVEESIHQAKAAGAEKIVLCCHYGVAQDLPDPILPESGLGRLENLCREHNIRLFFSGHEHTKGSPVRKYGQLYNIDAAMTAEQYGVAEIYPDCAFLTVYNTEDNSISRVDRMEIGGVGHAGI